jgi:hypothetical protein
MAQMLRATNSTETLLEISQRHARLCSHTPNGEQLAIAIQSKIEDLETKHQNRLKAKKTGDNTLDDVSLAELMLENSIRTLFDHCKHLDRDNPSGSILYKIFPEGKFGPYIEKTQQQLLDAGTTLLQRLENLGTEHSLYEKATPVREKIEKLQQTLQKYDDALKIEKQLFTAEQLAKTALREQYEINYFEARKQFRKNYANRLFPQISQYKRKKPVQITNTPPDSTPPTV